MLQADTALTACVLVDPMLRDPFPHDWLANVGCNFTPLPLKHPSLRDDQRPGLIQIRPQDVPVLGRSVEQALAEQEYPQDEQGAGFAIAGWLLTDGPVDALAGNLASCMQRAAPSTAGPRIVRWADRRVLEWMWPVLNDAQRAQLLGPASRWYALDRRNDLVCYERPLSAPGVGRLMLDALQWRHAQECEAVQDLLRGWRRFNADLPRDYLRQAADAMRSIRELAVSSRQDMVLLGAYVLQIHPRLATHPEFIAAVRRSTEGQRPLTEALAEIPDPEGWDAMRTDLQRAPAAALTT